MKVAQNKMKLGGFLTCSVILLVIGIYSLEAGRKFIAANQSVNHTHEVLHEFENILMASVDATVGERGYILTGDENFLILILPQECKANYLVVNFQKLVFYTPK